MTEHSAVAVAATRLWLLGRWELVVDGSELHLGHREQRLVSLLALGGRRTRAQVASTLWPDSTDERGLASLRRAVLHCQRGCPGLLEAERLTLALDPSVRVDVDDLRRAGGLTALPMTDDVAHELLDAIRGEELLPGWYDDWAVHERGMVEQMRVEALERIATHGLEHGDLELAVAAARTASEIEPMRESLREVAIRALVDLGDVAGALHELQSYDAVMRDELGVTPSSRITALVEPLLDTRGDVPEDAAAGRAREDRDDDMPWAGPTTSLDEFLDGPRAGRGSGVRRAGAALVAVAGVALAVSLAVALSGPEEQRQASGDPEGAGGLVDRALPLTPLGEAAPPSRTVRVRTVDSDRGRARFDVRADLRPAQVRLVVRGRAGLRVVRHVVVRAAAGRDVVVVGLDPGTYTWSATSSSASPVTGHVLVTPAVTSTPEASPTTAGASDVTQAVSTPSSSPTSQHSPTTTPAQTPSHPPSPTATATPPATSHPTPSPSPTHDTSPTDPGTVAPPPVG